MQPERHTDSSKERELKPQPQPESVISTKSLPTGDWTQDGIPFDLHTVPQPLFDPDNNEDWDKMVGRRVSVRWGDSERSKTKWYRGKVTKYFSRSQNHQVQYDDGDVSHYKLTSKAFRIEGEGFLYDGEKKVWPTPDKWTQKQIVMWMLWKAVEEGDSATMIDILRQKPELLEAHLDPHGCWSPMTLAAEYGHLSAVHTLLNLGASVNKATQFGSTPIYAASRAGHAHVVDCLVERGADINKAHDDGTTILSEAAGAGYASIVKTLILHGADVNQARTVDRMTPLMLAGARRYTKCVELLLEAGADQTIKLSNKYYNINALTAYDRAGNRTIKDLIKFAGPADERRSQFLRIKQCRREWARVISASAGTTTPRPVSSAWAIPTTDQLRAELRAAEGKAAAAQAEAMASAPLCKRYERKNMLFQKCKHCLRREQDCNKSREAHQKRLLCDKKVSDELTKMKVLSAAVSLSQFLSERPGLVRVLGARLLQYYDVNTA